ncbi:MAG TPA: trehalase family glycosidase [Candidatus Caenarcaniphilales bacterium]|nr:trehalase family glycosidase [Candidatus Caenarcaniphilales bacterium]
MSDDAPAAAAVTAGDTMTARRRRWHAVVALLGLLVLVVIAAAVVGLRPGPAAGPLELVPEQDLDRRWGTYLSEREWGTPREAIGGDGWGLSWRGAIDTDYRFSDDGIAGLSDANNEFRIGWAFWDGTAEHVTERFFGATNPQGVAGETILDDRVFGENTPNHAYSRLVYRYPIEEPTFEIELESAKYDSRRLVLSATVTNVGHETAPLTVVLKGWLAPGGEVEPLANGLLLRGDERAVALVGESPDEWQISADKGALDVNLREGALNGDEGGYIGALAYRLDVPAAGTETLRFALAEAALADESTATDAARDTLAHAGAVIDVRRGEADQLFVGQVAEHEPLYRQALMTTLWNESYYAWDGTSEVNPSWAGRVRADDVLIMPDKWEFPWIASWDSAFHAVVATLIEPEIAADQLRFLLSDRWQQPDGHIPCAEWVMDEECPPVFAWAAWRIYEVGRDREFLADVYPGLQRHYDYWWQHNVVEESFFTGGFLGMDNLPRSAGQAQADASAWMAFFARDMARIASELRDSGAAGRYWLDRGRIQEGINAWLWDEETSFYYDKGPTGRPIKHKSYSGLIPLVAGVVPPERIPAILEALRDEEQFLSPAGIRSVSAQSTIYAPGLAGRGINSNWRGPVWVPINYLLIEALEEIDPAFARDLRTRVVEAVERDWESTGRLHEFFDGDTGAGLGADAQGWTAVVANLIADGWPAPTAP